MKSLVSLSISLLLISSGTFAKAVSQTKAMDQPVDEKRIQERHVQKSVPYVPQGFDFGIELGSMWGSDNLYWAGANFGFHLGTCVFTSSQTCQQFLDFLWGTAGRESHSNYFGSASLRWQFVNFPSSIGPFARIHVGGLHSIIPNKVFQATTYGVGVGINLGLHPKADLRLESRLYKADRIYGMVFFGAELKVDRWVEYFAEKLEDIGMTTVKATGTVLEKTADYTGSAVETVVETAEDVGEGAVDLTGKGIEGAVGVGKGAVDLTGEGIKGVGSAIGVTKDKKVPNKK